MVIEKLEIKKVSDRIGEKIEKMITEGTFQAGEKLPSVRELCELFGVGRSAVRDAITALKGKGFVDVKQGEGTYVCGFDSTKLFKQTNIPVDVKDLTELFQVRKIMETGIVEIAAKTRNDNDISKMKETLFLSDVNGWEADYQFHKLIAIATGNDIFIQLSEFISESMKQTMIDFYRYIADQGQAIIEINQQHEQLLSFIESGSAVEAKQMMTEHLLFVEDLFLQSLKNVSNREKLTDRE